MNFVSKKDRGKKKDPMRFDVLDEKKRIQRNSNMESIKVAWEMNETDL